MKKYLTILLLFIGVSCFAQCASCPGGMSAPGASSSPVSGFHGYTSEVNHYDGTAITCYTPLAGTLNGHLEGINNSLCELQNILDSLERVYTVHDSTFTANIDTINVHITRVTTRIDSIVTALGGKYNTKVISSDSSLNISVDTVGHLVTYDVGVENDSVAITATNGLTGNGQSYKPLKIGGALTENTTLTGNHEVNLNANILRLNQNDSTAYQSLFELRGIKKYAANADFTTTMCDALSAFKTSVVSNSTFNLFTLNTSLEAHVLTHVLKLNSSSVLRKTGDTTTIGYGDVGNSTMGFDAQQTLGGNITSMRNLTLAPIFKASNSLPFTCYRYVSLALSDLTQTNGTPSAWIVPTDRYAIFQEGTTDKNVFRGFFMLPNLGVYADDAAAAADATLPSKAAYLITGSTVQHIKP